MCKVGRISICIRFCDLHIFFFLRMEALRLEQPWEKGRKKKMTHREVWAQFHWVMWFTQGNPLSWQVPFSCWPMAVKPIALLCATEVYLGYQGSRNCVCSCVGKGIWLACTWWQGGCMFMGEAVERLETRQKASGKTRTALAARPRDKLKKKSAAAQESSLEMGTRRPPPVQSLPCLGK